MLKFRVEYYDAEEKRKLSALSCAQKVDAVVTKGLEIPKQDFFAYSMFREQKQESGWRTYDELVKHLPPRIQIFEQYFDLSCREVVSRFKQSDDTDIKLTESAGVGASLALVSYLYGLIEADWEKIPVARVKDLDFEVAATQKEIVEVEAKGAIVSDTLHKTEISQRATHIREKKITQRANQNKNTLIGVIVSFPKQAGQDVVCRLLDPDGEDIEIPPAKYKLLARLRFYYRAIRTISHAHFLIALINRISELEKLRAYEELDQLPLLNIDGEIFNTPASLRISRSTVGDDFAFGEIVPLGNGEFYYYGLVFSIINLLIKQSFSDITNFNVQPTVLGDVRIVASIRKSELTAFGLDKRELREIEGSYYRLSMHGNLSVTSSGRVIGRRRFV